jgi:hypothetical protein
MCIFDKQNSLFNKLIDYEAMYPFCNGVSGHKNLRRSILFVASSGASQ